MNANPWVLSAEQSRTLDEIAIRSGIRGETLMEHAGKNVADLIRSRFSTVPVTVLCGPGNNGGDGFVIARLLQEAGWPVNLCLLGSREILKGDAAIMAARWPGAILPLNLDALADAKLVVDAVFGTGLTRPLPESIKPLLDYISIHNTPVVSVDIPSGLATDTDALIGPAFSADVTVTFTTRKPCHLLYPAKEYCGEVVVTDIGIPAENLSRISPDTCENTPLAWNAPYPFPRTQDHKYTRGHVLVTGGDAVHSGAARMAARAALRTGAGLVTVAMPAAAVGVYAAHLTAVMLHPFHTPEDFAETLHDDRISACLIGPGNGINDTTEALLRYSIAQAKPLVVDADGLTVLAQNKSAWFPLLTPAILTPHQGEFKRLFAITGNKLHDAREAARESGAVIVYKGADTVIAAPNGRTAIQPEAPPWLATAGSGDVLAGICAGLLGLGLDPFTAACQGVWLHSRAGFHHGPGMIAEDLIETIPAALADLEME